MVMKVSIADRATGKDVIPLLQYTGAGLVLPNVGDVVIDDPGNHWKILEREFSYSDNQVIVILWGAMTALAIK